jgi:hypothetical protein
VFVLIRRLIFVFVMRELTFKMTFCCFLQFGRGPLFLRFVVKLATLSFIMKFWRNDFAGFVDFKFFGLDGCKVEVHVVGHCFFFVNFIAL